MLELMTVRSTPCSRYVQYLLPSPRHTPRLHIVGYTLFRYVLSVSIGWIHTDVQALHHQLCTLRPMTSPSLAPMLGTTLTPTHLVVLPESKLWHGAESE
jgi:hypothetical protein